MKKRKRSKKNSNQNQSLKKIYISFFFLIAFLFLLLNIYFSQKIPPLYSKFVSEDKQAIITYLKQIKNLPIFKKDLKKFSIIFGEKIEKAVFLEEEERKIKIKKLETVLQKNPKSRDVLYSLYKLYQESGNYQLAEKYLQKAKEVDPVINY